VTLTDFLLARIDADEALARMVSERATHFPAASAGGIGDLGLVGYRFDRVLAECEAKRRIVERHKDCGTGYGYCDDGGHGWGGDEGLGCADLADLASVYAAHPDYSEEWAL
jgi:hypothetical protein